MIDNKFLYFLTYDAFKQLLDAENISSGSIAFVEDKSIIWTHGKEYDGQDLGIEVDEENQRLLVYGDPVDESSEEDTRRKYFIPMTELAKPNAPTISVTTYLIVVDGSLRKAIIHVANNTQGSTMEYSLGDHVIDREWYDTDGTIEIDPGFLNDGHTAVLPYHNTILLRTTKYGIVSDVNRVDITINPKVATPTAAITRSPNDNNWATSASALLTPSATAGATSLYSEDGGDDILTFSAPITVDATGEAGQIRLRATKSGFVDSDEYISPAFTLGNERAYYGFSQLAQLNSKYDIEALEATGGYQESTTLKGALTINPTGFSIGYVWLCCTGTIDKDSVIPNQHDVIPFGFEDPITIGDYHCYRSINQINPVRTDVYIP